MVSAETSSQSQSRLNRSRRPPAPIVPGRCATCNTQSLRYTYSHPPSDDVLRIFRLITFQATQQHFFCSHCIKCAQKKLSDDRALAQHRLADSLQRSAGHGEQERSDHVAVGSQPVNDNVSAADSVSSTSTEATIVRAVSKRPRPRIEESQDDVPSPPRAVRFAVSAADAAIDPDDIVPPAKRQKPSQKPRVRKQPPPTTVAAVPRSPGGRPISNAEYVRSGGG